MKYSQVFCKTLKQIPSGAESINHQLLIRGGFIHQEMAGVYSYLPLGLKVLNKISQIVREEMNKIGGQEILMPAIQPGENWKKTGRFNSFDVLFKFKRENGADLVLGPSHEEIVYPLLAEYLKSYKDLPVYFYQIQNKFRDEPRAKAGLLRGREFLMKDLYSFHSSDEDRDKYYEIVKKAYQQIFKRIGLPAVTTKASGGTFSNISEEFQTLTLSGEDTVYVCQKCGLAINAEVFDQKKCSECGGEFKAEKSIEVANIFPLKRSYAEVFGLYFTSEDGTKQIVSAGCYGLGISRVMGAIVEVFNDEKGIIWPEAVAPYNIHLIGLDLEDKKITEAISKIYQQLENEGIEVLFDDRTSVSAGEKFADADLIGIPLRVVISRRTQEAGKLEVKKRNEKTTTFMSLENLLTEFKK